MLGSFCLAINIRPKKKKCSRRKGAQEVKERKLLTPGLSTEYNVLAVNSINSSLLQETDVFLDTGRELKSDTAGSSIRTKELLNFCTHCNINSHFKHDTNETCGAVTICLSELAHSKSLTVVKT
jgi:hypothetical protein